MPQEHIKQELERQVARRVWREVLSLSQVPFFLPPVQAARWGPILTPDQALARAVRRATTKEAPDLRVALYARLARIRLLLQVCARTARQALTR